MKILKNFYFKKLDIYFLALFFISFLHPSLGLLFNMALLYYWTQGTPGCLKALVFLTTRGILNPAIASSTAFGSFRWVVILGSAFFILINRNKILKKNNRKYSLIFLTALYFSVFVMISGVITSSYPVTAMFKIVSFSLTFLAVIKGIAISSSEFKCNEFFVGLYTILFGISIAIIPFSQFRVVNDDFQGIFNHVNLFGIVGAVYLAALLHSKCAKKYTFFRNFMVVSVLVMIYLSASRTGLATAISVILIYFITNKKVISKKIIIYLSIAIIILICFPTGITTSLGNGIKEFLYKNNAEDIWASREEIIASYQEKYYQEPIMGTGFMVPYSRGVKDYRLNFDLMVEPGNLIWAVLGDTGIIGFFLFIVLFIVLLIHGKIRRVHLLLCAYTVCMGEMVFFSVNNMSVLLYILIGTYVFEQD